jgi:serine/threonine protein kinase/Flp pilus assembly protein TadD
MPISDAVTMQVVDTSALAVGSDFGTRYRIESLLGQGGMGRVYKAFDKQLDRTVAIKVVRLGVMGSEEALQRFKQELLLASKVSHKNILRIHDMGEAGDVKFISMAYVEGQDLHQILHDTPNLPFERALNFARQLAEALAAAHAEGVVHRDLKPQNILVGKDDHVYVSDFGLAKSFEDDAAGMTRTGAFLGTPRYMSPEQVEGNPADQRSDLYSYGLILYEMATGEVPFTGDTTLKLMYQRTQQRPRNPKLLNPNLPDWFAGVIMRCLEKDPATRYQNATEILPDLHGEKSSAISRRATRTVEIEIPEFAQKRWVWAAGGLLTLVLLSLAIAAVRHLIVSKGAGEKASSVSSIPSLAQGRFVAILPFRVLGDEQSLGYVAEGLNEALSAKLFQLQGLHLSSSAAAEKVSDKDPTDKVARALGANLIVTGIVQGSADNLRIIVNLDDATSGKRVWSQEFSGVTKDLLTIEDQISAQLVTALALKPTDEETARTAAHPTENIEAYDLYLKGRDALHTQQDVKNAKTAIGYYEDALKKDPRFALAYAGLAEASLVMYRENKDAFWSQKALAAAQQARSLNDTFPEVHFSLGNVYRETGRTAEAVTELKRALELSPNSDDGYRNLGQAYLALGQKDQGLETLQKAVQINPYYWQNYNALGVAYSGLGEYDKALTAFQRVTVLEPDNFFGYLDVGAIYFQQGKYEESISYFQKSLQLQPYYLTYSNLGTALFFLKRYSESVPMFEKAVELNPNEELAVGNLADAYRWSGQRDKANATYDKAIALTFRELQVNPRNPASMGSLAMYYAKKGDTVHALDYIRRARTINPTDVNLIYMEAQVYALANRPDDALKSLRQALQKGYSAKEASNDPELSGLQSRPEFLKLMKEFGKPN